MLVYAIFFPKGPVTGCQGFSAFPLCYRSLEFFRGDLSIAGSSGLEMNESLWLFSKQDTIQDMLWGRN